MIAEILTLPRLGETMESGRIVTWQKKSGDTFRRGETIVEVESDKTIVELPALVNGTLVEILAAEGDDIVVGAPLCRYERADAPIKAAAAAAVPLVAVAVPVPQPAAHIVSDERAQAASNVTAHKGRATPAARRLARTHAIDLQTVKGTGRRARVGKADVLALVQSPAAATASVAVTNDDPALRYVDLPQGRLAYRLWRSAARAQDKTVVLLHGFGGESQAWSNAATLLARGGLDVVAPDLPAHGATSVAATSFDELLEPIVAFVTGLDEPIELVGHSLGGAIAVAVALIVPERIVRLTLVAPAGLGSEIDADFVHGIAAVSSPGALAHLLRRIAVRPAPVSRAQLEHLVATIGRGTRLGQLATVLVDDRRQQLDIVSDLERLSVPARVVWGLEDRIIPWTHVAHLPATIPAHIVAGAGHMPQWDQPAKLASLFTATF